MEVAHSNITDELKITSKFLNFSFLINTSNGFFLQMNLDLIAPLDRQMLITGDM